MARRPAADERQTNIFGAILPVPPTFEPLPTPNRHPKRKQGRSRALPAPGDQNAPAGANMDELATRLSPAELDELAATLPDGALAHLILATMRQLRRRLARSGGHRGSRSRASALERAAQQLAAEFGSTEENSDP